LFRGDSTLTGSGQQTYIRDANGLDRRYKETHGAPHPRFRK
ncbi:MAG: hypothetical protein ACI9KE_005974, partial [Polyangiales bacterium]